LSYLNEIRLVSGDQLEFDNYITALIPLVKSGIAKPIPYYLHGMFHKAIKYMASGLFAVMATVFIKFIKKSLPMNPKEIQTKQENTDENKKSIHLYHYGGGGYLELPMSFQ